jgi:uncharacterized tellurite resistance protein B-like protein
MIEKLHRLLREHFGPQSGSADDDVNALQLATAILLVEVARADSCITAGERRDIRRMLEKHFGLTPELTRNIAASAESEARQATSLYPFTRLINRVCSADEKVRIIGMLWRVTCSDGRVDKYEEHLVRKIADLLYVPHREFIRTKLEVIERQEPAKPVVPGHASPGEQDE